MERFSQKQLAQMSELEFAAIVMREHANAAKNPHTPMAKKYRMAAYRLECLVQKEKSTRKNWWDITYTDSAGMKMNVLKMPEHELQRIGEMVSRGYACGEIIAEEEC